MLERGANIRTVQELFGHRDVKTTEIYTHVLIQTLAAPDWARLPDAYARVDGPKPFEPEISEGQRLQFRLVANPTIKKHRDGRKNGTRVLLVHPRAPEGRPEVSSGYLD